jgi:hypothetical protein
MDQGQEFNVDAFMNETFDATLDTEIIPVPEGEHMAQIGTDPKDVNVRTGVSQKNNRAWMMLELNCYLSDPNLAATLKRENPRIRYSIMLDLDNAGRLDTGPQRNVNLGKLRDAVNQNKPGQWSFAMLRGQPIKVKVKHKKASDGSDATYSEVVGVTKAM